MPQQEILLHTACELQLAVRGLDGRTNPKQFNARGWSIKVTLNPKVDADGGIRWQSRVIFPDSSSPAYSDRLGSLLVAHRVIFLLRSSSVALGA
jgi:hypothetical protein